MTGPLKGVRVVEMANGLAGAICGKLFADLGADVLLIERPRRGSDVRWLPPFLADLPGPERSGLFLYAATGKRSLTLDVASPDGRAVLAQLLARADLLIEDGGEGMDDDLRQANPGLVRLIFPKFSSAGPYEGYSATELQLAALGNWMMRTGEPGRAPLVSNSVTMTAFLPGLVGACAGLAAVLRGRVDGDGANLEVAAHEALLYATRQNETEYSYTRGWVGRSGIRFGLSSTYLSPTFSIFEAADGYVTCAAATNAQIELLLHLAGVDDRFASEEARYQHADELWVQLAAWVRSRTCEEAFHTGQEWRIPMAKVVPVSAVPQLEQVVARQSFVEVEHPVAGRRTYPGVPMKFSKTVPPPPRHAPLLGEHSAEVLGELGYNREDIVALLTAAPLADDQARATVKALPSGRSERAGRLPLEGVRVLDLTFFWAGPVAASILADLGAEVIKIEATQKLDGLRGFHHQATPLDSPWERSPRFNSINRNKLGITLNLNSDEGRRLFKALVVQSDVVMENFSPRVMPQFGLQYEVLQSVNPRIVMTSLSGFGQMGPWKDYVSYAAIGESLCGITDLTGYTGEGPLMHGGGVSDPYAGITAAFATLAALYHARQTGQGQHVDVSQLESSIPFIADAFMDFSLNGRCRSRNTNDDPARAPHGCFPTKGEDAWITISVGTEEEWQALLEVMGWPQWGQDPRFATPLLRRRHRAALNSLLAEWTKDQDKERLTQELQARGVSAAPVRIPPEQLEDPQLRATGFFQHLERAYVGRHPYPSFPVRLDGAYPPIRRPAPVLGEDNRYVFTGILGLDDAELARLEAEGVIGSQPAFQQELNSTISSRF